MYGIECGAQIPDNSKFCSHCGKPQKDAEASIKEKIIETEIIRQVIDERKQSIDYQFLRKAMGWYIAWALLHLGLLLIFSKSIFGGEWPTEYFWPFGTDRIAAYDITEFLVYTIFPLAILFILSMIDFKSDDSNTEESVN